MNKKIIRWVTLFLLAAGTFAEAQQKMYRVGVLMLGGADIPEIKGLRDGLKEAGYVEGKNLVLDFSAKETNDELFPIAKAYIEKKFDVIVAMGATAPLIASELTREIPIVFVGASYPVGSGLVKSVVRPETNVTGVARATDVEMQGKRLEVLRKRWPTLGRVAVMYTLEAKIQDVLKASHCSKRLHQAWDSKSLNIL